MKLSASIVTLTVLFALQVEVTSRSAAAPGSPTFTDTDKAGVDYQIQGEYAGTIDADGAETKFGIQVIALGDGKFAGVAYGGGLPGDGWDGATKYPADGELKDGVVHLEGEAGSAVIEGGVATVTDSGGVELGTLKKVQRESETLGAAPPEGAVVLFDGSNVDQWTTAEVGDGGLLVVPRPHAVSKPKFQDFSFHIEFRTPYMPEARGQGRGNCGVFLHERYEIQVLDSFGLEGKNNECGGVYSIHAPAVNACFPPLTWQTYDVDFTAAKFDENGEKVKDARATIRHNGILIHDDVAIPRITPGGKDESAEAGGILLHYHGNPVHFRNIWVVPKT